VSKPRSRGNLEIAVKITFLVLMALIFFADAGIFLLFFIPVAGWFIWSAHDKNVALEKRVAELEKLLDAPRPKLDEASPP